MLNTFIDYQLQNATGVLATNAQFFFVASIAIESDALLDPTVIDPGTGLPAGGKITFLFTYNYRDNRNMQDGDRQRLHETLVRAGNTGLTKAQFRDSFGIPAAVVDAMFAGPMTVSLDITGNARYVTDASITCNMRLFGD